MSRPRRRIYLLRHGAFANAGAAKGLTDEGRSQVLAVRELLADVRFDRVVASTMPRSIETARLVAGDDVPIDSIPALDEIAYGTWWTLGPEAALALFRRALDHGGDRTTLYFGGESYGALIDRVLPAFRALLADPGWTRMLLAAHAFVNLVIVGHVLGMDMESPAADLRFLGTLEQDDGALNLIDIRPDGRLCLRLFNFTAYAASKSTLVETPLERLFASMTGRDPYQD